MIDRTEQIRQVLMDSSDLTERDMESMTNDSNIRDFGIDSLSLVEAIIELEHMFNIEIDNSGPWMEEAELTVNGINKMINEKLHG